MNVKAIAIEQFAKFIVGGLLFNKVQNIVKSYSSTELSGEEKRKAAIKDLQDIGSGFGACVLNLALELGVLFLKEKGILK